MLSDELRRQGSQMYRWRGYLPLLMVPIVVLGFRGYRYPFNSHLYDTVWEMFCLVVSFVGLGIRFAVMGYSPPGSSYVGESTKRIQGGFKTKGLYSLCRNPLYLGNFFLGLGVFLFVRSLLVTLIYVVAFFLYYERLILGEEEFLATRFGDEYLRWTERTPLILPRFSNWVRPDFPFSWRIAIRREYKRTFGLITIMMVLEIAGDLIVEGSIVLDPVWGTIFVAGFVFYLSVLFLKRKTRLLNVPR